MRWLLYIIPIFVLSIAGFFIGTSVLLTSEVIFIALGVNISLLLDLARKQLFTEKRNFRIIANESKLISLASEFKKKAVSECCIIWTAEWKVPDLDAYFEEEKKILAENKSLKIRRLIGTDNSNWSRKEMAEHVANFASFIASGKYKCKETHTKGFEVVYADHEEKGNSYRRSLLIMNENDRKVGFLFDEFESPMQAAMVLAVKAFFESEWAAALNYGQEQNKVLELDEKRN